MNDFSTGYTQVKDKTKEEIDPGLRNFMLGVYRKLALGLALSGIVAFVVANVPAVTSQMFRFEGNQVVGYSPLGWVVTFAPLALILFSNFITGRLNPRASGILYWAFVSLMGASLGVLFLVYSGAAIFTAFLITATAFGALSLFGYATKRNLTGVGSFLIMALWGLIATSLLTLFVPGLYSNPLFFFGYNLLGVVIFGGLIAWETQTLKTLYFSLRGDGASMAVATNYGALNLFISFVNLFRIILALGGGGGSRR